MGLKNNHRERQPLGNGSVEMPPEREGSGSADSPVTHAFGAGAVHADYDKDVLEVGPDALWSEGKCSGLLEDNGHDVISYVPFPQKLQARQRPQTQSHTQDFR